ncbi:MAG: hypothetical protein K2H52_11365 [Lachnospiraceae bacterium]|nr:hypothetical protein [Lachnospiraceae bacterium]
MKLAKVFKEHAGQVVVLQPLMRDAATNRPLAYKVLRACTCMTEAVKAQWYCLAEGFEGVFIYPCAEDAALAPEDAARMFRVLYGRE